MMTQTGLTNLCHEIMALGYDEETASHYAVLLGDTPATDERGRYLVMEQGRVLATLPPLRFYQDSE